MITDKGDMKGMVCSWSKSNERTFWPSPAGSNAGHPAYFHLPILKGKYKLICKPIQKICKRKNIYCQDGFKRDEECGYILGICKKTNRCQMPLNFIESKGHDMFISKEIAFGGLDGSLDKLEI